MAYATIPNSINRSPSPTLHDTSHTPLSSTFEHLSHSVFSDQSQTHSRIGVSGVLRSFTSSQHSANSYELVEEDDYEQPQVTPKVDKTTSGIMGDVRHEDFEQAVPVRTASISRNLPLHNPTPDLQSLQGAYLKNVERLEVSAERLSLAGSIDEEIQKLRFDLNRKNSNHSQDNASDILRRQTSAPSNSILGVNVEARAGGYSPGGYIASPTGSVRSRKISLQQDIRSSQPPPPPSDTLLEPEFEGRPLESAMVHSPPSHNVQPRLSSDSQKSPSIHSLNYDRPGTSASNDTYRQAQHLFTDFDGTHFAYHDDSRSRRISLSHPPLARDSRAFKEPQPGEKMVYYPAPVPVMLNLPKRLSRGDWAVKEKRRTQALSQIPAEMRKSAAWLANVDSEAELDTSPDNRHSNLPAQLRASAFFDSPGIRSDVKLKEGSAVRTLDSILDAAAHAPVSAFTDHPIAGHLGSEVYGQETRHKKKSSEIEKRRKSSLSNVLSIRKSSDNLSTHRRLSQVLDHEVEMADDDAERIAEKSIAPGEDEIVDDEDREKGEGEESEEEEEHQLGFLGAPTTLLAELQMRKAQQKLRNKTAADAFPDGMHSTLLELDAVAQLQQKSRKMKHVALAWEDQEAAERTNHEDEDVPLAVLFPEKNQASLANMHRPIGLMERREMEENEPLGQRRARLRGEVYQPRAPSPLVNANGEDSAPTLNIDGPDEHEEEIEGETLGQRIKRLKEKKDNQRTSLADDIASQLGLDPEQIGGTKTPEVEEEETLGQRRKRLQAEADKAKADEKETLKPKISMGDLLRANPVGPRNEEQQAAAASKISLLSNRPQPGTSFVEHIQAKQPGSRAIVPPGLGQGSLLYLQNQPVMSHGTQFGQQQPGYHPLASRGQTNGFMQSTPSFPQFQQQFPQMHMNMPGMQSMPHLNPMPIHNGQFQPIQHPFGNQFTNMSNMSLGMNNMMNTNMNYPQMQMPYMHGYGAASAYDPIAMGPPLDSQQRATIDQWRQGIA